MRCHNMVRDKMKVHLWFILICIPDLKHRASTFQKNLILNYLLMCACCPLQSIYPFSRKIETFPHSFCNPKNIIWYCQKKNFLFLNNNPRWNTWSQLRPATEPAVFTNLQWDKYTVQMNHPKMWFLPFKKTVWFKFLIAMLLRFHIIESTGSNR